MTAITRAAVETALKGYVDPYLEQDLLAAKCLKQIRIEGDRVEVEVELGFPAAGYRETLTAALPTTSSRSAPARAGSANRPRRLIWRWR